MKKTLNIGIGGKSFIIDEDAHDRLKQYLDNFRSRLADGQGEEVMNDIEARIAELLNANLGSSQQTVSLNLVNQITAQLGMPDGKPEFTAIDGNNENDENNTEEGFFTETLARIYIS